ncbi:VOC family protein [bacterium]|nr:VOC family protein [bacterium]
MFRLDHIGVVVEKLEPMVELYCRLLNYPPDKVEYHDVPSEGVRVAMLKGNTILEFLQPTDPDSGIGKFLAKRGAGFHHFCYGADAPVENKLAELKANGFAVLSDEPRQGAEGRVFFVHPKSAGGILTEFVENE